MANRASFSHLANLLQSCIDKKARLLGKVVHAHVLRHGFFADIFLSNRLIELYSQCGCPDHASRVFNAMPHRNVFSWNAILSAHCKARNLDIARKMLTEMPERNVVSWNTVISTLARSGYEGNALDLYYTMIGEGFMPTHFTFASVLSACGGLMELEQGRRCHALAVKVGLGRNSFVENALVGMYAKCGKIGEAMAIFDAMSQVNEVSFTAMMGGLVQGGSTEEALKLFVRMHRAGVRIDAVAVSTVLGVCARMKEEKLESADENYKLLAIPLVQPVHALVIKCGFEWDTLVGNSLIDMYVKFDHMDIAETVFRALPAVNVGSWNVLVAAYGQKGDCRKVTDLLEQMSDLGFEPDDIIYTSQLTAFVKSGDLESACQTFYKILDPGVTAWNTLLSCYNQDEDHENTIRLFREMQFFHVHPDRTTLAIVLSSCSGIGLLDFGKQIHAASTRLKLCSDMYVASALVDMYSKCGHIKVAKCVFDRMPERDVVCWNAIISGFALHSLSKEAFIFFKQMRANGMSPTQYSYATVISSCARLSSLAQGSEIHAQTEKDGFVKDVFVGSALIDMYAKCGNVEEAHRFFNMMSTKNIVSWNEMIHGYAQNGLGYNAVELYREMLSTNEKPDHVTFIAALTACSHSGLVDEGLMLLESMENEHGIKPMADHYTCIIDALGRAGRFEELEVLINKMTCKDDPIIWEVLLNACRVHGNLSLGKVAAEQLFRLDPENSASYVLLSNTYAELGRWNDVSAVRKLMNDRRVVKDRGYSWIDHKDGVQAFMVDDDLRILNDRHKLSNDVSCVLSV